MLYYRQLVLFTNRNAIRQFHLKLRTHIQKDTAGNIVQYITSCSESVALRENPIDIKGVDAIRYQLANSNFEQ